MIIAKETIQTTCTNDIYLYQVNDRPYVIIFVDGEYSTCFRQDLPHNQGGPVENLPVPPEIWEIQLQPTQGKYK